MSGVRFLNAVSMTDTGTPCWTASLRMFCRQAWKSDCASAGPAVMAVVAARMIVLMRGVMPPILSRAGDGHAFYSHRRRVGRALELQVAGRRQVEEHVLEIARHGDAAHRPGALAVLDPEAGGAAAVVAGDSVHAKADQIGDVESALDVGDQLVARELALLEIEIGRGRAGRAGGAARRVPGGLEIELAGGGEVEQPGGQHAVIDHGVALGRQSFGVERPAAQSALAQGIVEDADALGEDL